MRRISIIAALVLSMSILGCGNEKSEGNTAQPEQNAEQEKVVSDPKTDKGVGPVTSITLGEIDPALVEQGKALFTSKCSACHKIDKRFVGPALKGAIDRRTPEWIMNMILNPDKMVVENEEAKKLLAEYLSPMANQSLKEEEARAILEYLRTEK
jgi:mono/diheme cytochrome c family protein